MSRIERRWSDGNEVAVDVRVVDDGTGRPVFGEDARRRAPVGQAAVFAPCRAGGPFGGRVKRTETRAKATVMKSTTGESRASELEFVVLYGVPWETYEGILDALGEYHLRHTYDEGTLEMRRVLEGVNWEDYLKLLDATHDFSLPHTYDEGTLEMMSPGKDHDWVANLIARMIEAAVLALDIPIQSIGSTTLRAATGGAASSQQSLLLGARAASPLQGNLRARERPPPDLVIEIDVTRSFVPRLPVLAKIGVPKLWRDERGRLRFYGLGAKARTRSGRQSRLSFP